MEELLLGGILALEEVDVIDEQDIHLAELVLEVLGALATDRLDELIGEHLGGHVHDLQLRGVLQDIVADRAEQVGLAQTDASVDEAGVVTDPGVLGDGQGCVVCKCAVVPDDEGGELVGGVEVALSAHLRALLCGYGALGIAHLAGGSLVDLTIALLHLQAITCGDLEFDSNLLAGQFTEGIDQQLAVSGDDGVQDELARTTEDHLSLLAPQVAQAVEPCVVLLLR